MKLPTAPGACALVIELDQAAGDLRQGRYLYAGSAYGPGGIRARVRRHMKRDKPLHWHVDRLTAAGCVTRVFPVPGGHECAIIATALKAPGISVAAPGFGSSDCRTCPAHLLRLADDLPTEDVAQIVRAIDGRFR